MRRRLLFTLLPIFLAVAAGVVAGLFIPQDGLRDVVAKWLDRSATDSAASPDSGTAHEDDHLDVSRAAQQSLGLKLGVVSPRSFTATFSVPAVVVERPAVSDLHVVTEFEGIVEEILAVPGQAIAEGTPLFRIRLTGDALASAQAALLDAVQQLAILEQEIARLRPAAEQGGLAGKSLLEQEYEKKRLLARIEAKRQELSIRGLSAEQIAQITDTKQLVRTVTVSLPIGISPQLQGADESLANVDSHSGLQDPESSIPASPDRWPFTIEQLDVTPGRLVRPGDSLCNVAYHASLSLMGQAFERDVQAIAAAIADRYEVTAELGEDRDPLQLTGLRIVHLDNHVDPVTLAYRFYVELENEILQDNVRDDGRRFRTWRFKPGQRGHIGLPQRHFSGVFVLPREAVTMDGLEAIVFRRQKHQHHASEDHGSHADHDEDVDQFVPVPVNVLHRDRRQVVVGTGGELKPGQVIAMNSAYQLLMAMKSQAGGGHDHHHDH